jgi:hypothetical protein
MNWKIIPYEKLNGEIPVLEYILELEISRDRMNEYLKREVC